MNSITAMIFSLKAWPIRLLGYMNISAIACHFYKCVASRHGYVSMMLQRYIYTKEGGSSAYQVIHECRVTLDVL